MKTLIPFFLLFLFAQVAYAQPTSAPPAPTQAAVDVVSLFSDAYTDVTGLTPTTFGVNNNTAVVANEAGNDVYQFNRVDGDFQGFNLDAAIDLTPMENIHYDIWIEGTTNVGAIFNTTVSQHGGGHLTGQTAGYVNTNAISQGQEGQWLSFDIPFNTFAPDLSTSARDIVSQLVFTYTNLTDVGPIYVDNIYFWKSPTNSMMDASLSDLQVDGTTIDGFSPTKLDYTVNLSSATPVPQITSATTTNGNASASITQATAVPGQASVEVTAEDGTTMQTYTVDFVITGPTSAPPTPTIAASRVISLFSDAYTDVTGLTPNNFGVHNNTAAVVNAAGNDVYEFTLVDGTFQGFDLGASIDLSMMDTLHYDLWIDGTTSAGAVFNTTISQHGGGHLTGQTDAYVHTNPVATGQEGQWLSFDIPLNTFAPDLTAGANDIISQLVFTFLNITTTGPLYVDNIYFYNDMVTSTNDINVVSERINIYPNPIQVGEVVNVSENPALIEVYSIDGQLLRTSQTGNVNTTGMQSGIYILQITTQNGELGVKKLIVH